MKGIQIVSAEEAERSVLVVCESAGVANRLFADNVQGECADCGAAIAWRPHAPQTPPKICAPCAVKRLET